MQSILQLRYQGSLSPFLVLLVCAVSCVDESTDTSHADAGKPTSANGSPGPSGSGGDGSDTEGPASTQMPSPNASEPSVSPSMPGTPTSSTARPSTDDAWDEGLTEGANGPIPFIVVDQIGYRPAASKVAVIRNPQTGYDAEVGFTPGQNYALMDRATDEIVKEGAPVPWKGGDVDDSSGDEVWWFDFSDVTAPGTYVVIDVDNDVRSPEFVIADDIYRSVLQHAVRTYFYQRAGFDKSADTAGAEWADGPSHIGPGQDSEAHAWEAQSDESLVRDLHGGWYDAGDYNKYTSWAAGTVIALLRAYEENAAAFGDDTDIPESGNGVPDIIDEVKWALDWLVRMQNDDGSLLCILGLAGASPPSAATDPSFYGPATTNATLMGAAVFAYAGKVLGQRSEAEFKAYAEDLGARAVRAWDWAVQNPAVTFYNNDEGQQVGSSGLGAGQQETDDAGRLASKFQAAMYLYELTGGAAYQAFAEDNVDSIVPSWGPTQWDMEGQDAVLHYAGLEGVSADTKNRIVSAFTSAMQGHADQLPSVMDERDPYRAPMQDYTWGSNQIKMAQARLYQLLAKHGTGAPAERAQTAAEEYVHYLHGVNPLGLVYLTNMARAGAEHSASTMYHTWFADGTRWDEVSSTTPGPAPGFVVGGPNLSFATDSCCTAPQGDAAYRCYGAVEFALCGETWEPPMGQPVQKSYLQFNAGWPAGSWSITEPSTGYQAKYVLVLSAYAD